MKVVRLQEKDIERLVKKILKEDFDWNDVLGGREDSKWHSLELDLSNCIEPIIEKYSKDFGSDSYAVIDAIYQVLDGMFEKVRK